ncbi:lipopolysaccharide biosynthesis protein [Nocardioides pacificus]
MANTRLAVPGFLRSGGFIAVAMAVMNVATYGFTMIAARILGPRSYGALAGLMATLLVVSVVQLGLQATAARRISSDPEHVGQIEDVILRVAVRGSIVLGLVMLALSPVVNRVLRLDDLPTAMLVAVAAVPITLMGGQAGILQGERRWYPLAVMYIASGVPRLAIGTALLLWRPSETSAIAGVALGAVAPVIVGWYVLRGRHPGERSSTHAAGAVVRETIHNSQALLAFFALSNLDIVVARNVLDDHSAGLYAGGLILTKAVLFLPQFVVVVAFPAMSSVEQRRRALTRSLLLVAGLGSLCTLAVAVLPGLAMVFVGGAKFADVESRLWLFSVLGTLLAMLQLLVYAVLARQGQRSVYLIWGTLGVMVVAGIAMSTLDTLLAVVASADAVLLAVLLAVSLRHTSSAAPSTGEATEPATGPATGEASAPAQ